MSKRINMTAGQTVSGGPGLGLMTAAGNPWTVADALADELVNRRAASYVDAQSVSPVAALVDPATGALIGADGKSPASVSGDRNPADVPAQIAGLEYWLDASEPMYSAGYAARAINAGDPIAIWPDKSGNPKTITQAAFGGLTYEPAAHNGKPGVKFNGANAYFTVTGLLDASTDAAITIFAVSNRSDGGGTGVLFATSTVKTFQATRNGTTKQVNLLCDNLTGTGISSGTSRNAALIEMHAYNKAAGTRTVIVDGICYAANSGLTSSSQGSFSKPYTDAGGLGLGVSGQVLGIGASQAGVPGGFLWLGTISEFIVFSRALSVDEQGRVLEYLSSKWGGKRVVNVIGNSLTAGFGSSGGQSQSLVAGGSNYPGKLWALLGAAYDVRADCYIGRTLTQMMSEDKVAALIGKTSVGGKPINIIWESTNQLAVNKSAAGAIQKLRQYCAQARAAGGLVIVMTALPRADAGLYAGFAADAAVVNADIRNNYRQFAEAICDVAADPRLQDPNNATYFNADKVHLIDAGYAVVAELVAPIVRSL